ncbi:MAG: DUF819 family protein [Phycisphaerae bacterium]|nr:DUF819 family protein [Phycisphaerae bacterium]
MKSHPVYIMCVLVCIEAAILFIDSLPVGKKLFRFLPSMFWIYCVPMLANTVGILPAESSIYGIITRWVLPGSLVVLLLSADIRGIVKLGPTALGVMAASVAGIMIGAPAVMLIYRHWLPADAWQAVGTLSGSWIGGSANMVAVGEGIGIPEAIYQLLVITDTIIPYAWMGLLIALSAHQQKFDRWNKSNTKLLDDLVKHANNNSESKIARYTPVGTIVILAIAAAGAGIAVWASLKLPVVENVISPVAWSVILATVLGIGLSFSPARRLESRGSNRIGFILLYLVLASIGAKTNLSFMGNLPIFLIAGATWIMIHAICLLLAVRLLRAPMALAAAASQSSIGGPASGPVVAGIYHPDLAPVGLLLAVLGNIAGTFLGLTTAQVCRWLW